MTFEQTTLDNGLTIIGEINPNVQSVAFGFYVRTGARDETPEVAGVSHFLEHMVFKGTERYSPVDVNRIFDEVGAQYNASTSEEMTLFYAAILPEYLPRTFTLLADILYPSLRDEDFNMEKKVILEEIGMYADMPTFMVYEKLMELHFRGHPLSHSVLGSVESITALTAEQMRDYHRTHYRAGNMTLVVAGNIDWESVVSLAGEHCGDWPAGSTPRNTAEASPLGGLQVLTNPQGMQEHVAQMASAPSAQSPLRFAADILSIIVGDDANSRLYWELIEPGLAESADMSYSDYDGTGAYMTFLTCHPDNAAEHMERISQIYATINSQGVTAEELEQAKNKVAARIVLRTERPMGRLGSLGGNWVYRQEYRSVEDDLNSLQQLSLQDIEQLLQEYPLGQQTTVAFGPLTELGQPAL